MITLRNVDVFHGKVHAVRRVSMHVREGAVTALIGANGAGKTTILSTISGLIRPAGGSILFDKRPIEHEKPERITAFGVAHAPEGRRVFGPLSVEDNLRLGAYLRLFPRRDPAVETDLDAMYGFFPVLRERRKQAAGTLSGGEQQMLAIARALMSKPKALLLDEPGMGLAPMIVKEIFKRIRTLADGGLTVLLVEQNAKAALKIADHGYVLETGRVLMDGPADELLHNQDVKRAYLGRET